MKIFLILCTYCAAIICHLLYWMSWRQMLHFTNLILHYVPCLAQWFPPSLYLSKQTFLGLNQFLKHIKVRATTCSVRSHRTNDFFVTFLGLWKSLDFSKCHTLHKPQHDNSTTLRLQQTGYSRTTLLGLTITKIKIMKTFSSSRRTQISPWLHVITDGKNTMTEKNLDTRTYAKHTAVLQCWTKRARNNLNKA